MKDLKLRILKSILVNIPLKIPTEAPCPKCKSPVFIVTLFKKRYILCSNVFCDYIEEMDSFDFEDYP